MLKPSNIQHVKSFIQSMQVKLLVDTNTVVIVFNQTNLSLSLVKLCIENNFSIVIVYDRVLDSRLTEYIADKDNVQIV